MHCRSPWSPNKVISSAAKSAARSVGGGSRKGKEGGNNARVGVRRAGEFRSTGVGERVNRSDGDGGVWREPML